MNFECKQLSITDDDYFGCEIVFKDTIDKCCENLPIEELLYPTFKYHLFQRSYPEM